MISSQLEREFIECFLKFPADNATDSTLLAPDSGPGFEPIILSSRIPGFPHSSEDPPELPPLPGLALKAPFTVRCSPFRMNRAFESLIQDEKFKPYNRPPMTKADTLSPRSLYSETYSPVQGSDCVPTVDPIFSGHRPQLIKESPPAFSNLDLQPSIDPSFDTILPWDTTSPSIADDTPLSATKTEDTSTNDATSLTKVQVKIERTVSPFAGNGREVPPVSVPLKSKRGRPPKSLKNAELALKIRSPAGKHRDATAVSVPLKSKRGRPPKSLKRAEAVSSLVIPVHSFSSNPAPAPRVKRKRLYCGEDDDNDFIPGSDNPDDDYEPPSSPLPARKRARKDTSDPTARRFPCPLPGCSFSFGRKADMCRHLKAIHDVYNLDDLYSERREVKRQWCFVCRNDNGDPIIFARPDSRRRHEDSCVPFNQYIQKHGEIENITRNHRERRGKKPL